MPELNAVKKRLNDVILSLAEKRYDEKSYSLLIDELTFRTFQARTILAGGSGDAKIEHGHFINNPPPVFAQI